MGQRNSRLRNCANDDFRAHYKHKNNNAGIGKTNPNNSHNGHQHLASSLINKFEVQQCSPWGKYERRTELGEGGFSTIYRSRHRTTGESFAIKMLKKSSKYSQDSFLTEVKLLRNVKHANIVKFIESFEDSEGFYIVMELQRGRDLFDVLDDKRDVFPEVTAARLLRIMASAIEYCHSNQIVHLDLKPENFVFARANDLSKLTLIDFGLGRVVKKDVYYHDRVGSMQYIAPEMMEEPVRCTGSMLKACDMWSMGVILYIIVSGLIPYSNWDEVKHGDLRVPRFLSRELRHLLKGLLTRDWKRRLTAKQVLEHPFVTGQTIKCNPIYQAIGAGVSVLRMREQPHILRTVAQGMVLPLSVEDRYEIDELFEEFDTDRDGRLSAIEFQQLLSHLDNSGAVGHKKISSNSTTKKIAATTAQLLAGVTAKQSSENKVDDTNIASRPRARSDEDLLMDVDGDGDGLIGRKDLAHLAAIGMIAQITPLAKRRIAFAFGSRKSKRYITKQELRSTLKNIPSRQLDDLFLCKKSNTQRPRIPIEAFATAILQRS